MTNMKAHSETTFEVMHLLEEILDGFQDGYCRPANQIALYEKYLELRQTYNAKLIRHLIVIDGDAATESRPVTKSLGPKSKNFSGS
jgi:hypothetical protein